MGDDSTEESKIKIDFCNMPLGKPFLNLFLDLKVKAIDFVKTRFAQSSKHTMNDMQLAKELKSHFDEFFHPTWQCIVGKNFGS